MDFLDAHSDGLDSGVEFECDICIVGTGAAGIAIACALDGSPLQVLAIEGGGLSTEEDSQALNDIENIGYSLRKDVVSRWRRFGGTTHTWGSKCVQFAEIDFAARDYVSDSGWPISFQDLKPYYRRAARWFDLRDIDSADAKTWWDDPSYRALTSKDIAPNAIAWTPHQNLGETYRKQLQQSPNVRVLYHANVTEIQSHPDGRAVSRLVLQSLGGKTFTARARAYILACGGLENARLLLASRDRHANGLGNAHDTVGRYFMEHPKYAESAVLKPPSGGFSAPALFRGQTPLLGEAQLLLALSEDTQRREQLLNHCAYTLVPQFREHQTPGFLGWQELREGVQSKHLSKVLSGFTRMSARAGETIAYGTKKILRQPLQLEGWTIVSQLEQPPRRDSRIQLSSKRDRFGVPLARLDWRVGSEEVESLRRFHRILKARCESHQIGEFVSSVLIDSEFVPHFNSASHHMGGTRMGDSPHTSTVDSNCRVRGLGNLFVAGSSVFPTSGYANPTLTLVALAIRLADHLQTHVRETSGVTFAKPDVFQTVTR